MKFKEKIRGYVERFVVKFDVIAAALIFFTVGMTVALFRCNVFRIFVGRWIVRGVDNYHLPRKA